MRFFKHGEVLAISLPESLRKKLGIADDDEFEFSENPDGSLKLARKSPFAQAAQKPGKPASAANTPAIRTEAKADPAPAAAQAGAPMPWTQKPSTSNPPVPSGIRANPATPAVSAKPSAASSAKTNPASANAFASTGTELDRHGYVVLENELDAKNFSHRFETLIKAGDIKGIRGFDKKFYLASRAYTDAFADRLLVALKEPKTVADLASLTKQPQEGVLTLLYLLKEEGEIIEKKRGLFVRVL